MVKLICQLGHEFGCERMLLVSNANQVVYKAIRKGRVVADYDRLWEELGAHKRLDGDYQINCTPLAPPDWNTIRSNKRAEARRRFAMLVYLANELAARLHAPRFLRSGP